MRRAPSPKSSGLSAFGGSFEKRSSPAETQVISGSTGESARSGGVTGGVGSGATTGGVASHPRRSHTPRSQPSAEQRVEAVVLTARATGGGATSPQVSP